MKTEIGRKAFRNWRMGLMSRDDIQSLYIDKVAEYFDNNNEIGGYSMSIKTLYHNFFQAQKGRRGR